MTKGKKIEVTEHGRTNAYTKTVKIAVAKETATHTLLGVLFMRHWKGLSIAGNAILVLNFVFPQWFELVKSLIG